MSNPAEGWSDSLKVVLREYAESLIIAIILAVVVRSYVVSAYQVPTTSMRPNLVEGDFILGYKLPFGVRLPFADKKLGAAPPLKGDTVIFRCPQAVKQKCIKRVIGLPGDRIEIRRQRLIVNGKMAHYRRISMERGGVVLREVLDSHIREIMISGEQTDENFGPVIVPPGHFFVLGDHRDSSQDSRKWGSVPYDLLEARAVLVWLSFDWGHPGVQSALPKVRWERLFHWVD